MRSQPGRRTCSLRRNPPDRSIGFLRVATAYPERVTHGEATSRDTPDLPAVLSRVLSAPRAHTARALSRELHPLVPHTALVVLTGDCARAPVQSVGPASWTAGLTPLGARDLLASGSAATPDGREAITFHSAEGAGLILLRENGAPPIAPRSRDAAALVWDIVAVALADRATGDRADWASSNREAASARSAALDGAGESHATTLTALLATLRSTRLDDARARRDAIGLASDALLAVRRGTELERDLTGSSAKAAFAELRSRAIRLLEHREITLDWQEPADDDAWGKDIAQVAVTVSRAALVAAVENSQPTRVQLSWVTASGRLRIEVRSDSATPIAADDPALILVENLAGAVGGAVTAAHDAMWGATITVELSTGPGRGGAQDDLLAALSRREYEILAAVAAGMSNRQIADDLSISEHTVKFHVHNVLGKLGVANRAHAAAIAHDAGLSRARPG